jgi:hypothetical protein
MASILAKLRLDGVDFGSYASAKLNSCLANASAMLASIPFVDVPPLLSNDAKKAA